MKPTLILTLSLVSACGGSFNGDGNLTDQTRTVTEFSSVRVAGGLPAQITVGPTSVIVHIDANLQEHVDTRVEGGVLIIEPHDKTNLNLSAGSLVRVVNPRIEGVDLSGGVVATAETSSVAKLVLGLSGGSKLTASRISSDRVELECSGGSTAILSGMARVLAISASGGSTVESTIPSTDVELTGSGGSTIHAIASHAVTGSLSGGTNARITGSPATHTVDVSGGSAIELP